MITFPIAKVNLGLNVVERRPDNYHNLQTVFYPVGIKDALEVFLMAEEFPSKVDCDIKVTNILVDGDEQNNLVVRAYNLLKHDYPALPRLHAHLYKDIPTQAGMGGGSSDASAMLVLLNREFHLNIPDEQLIRYAAQLGADCAFFISCRPAYAEGIGDLLTPINLDLSGWHMAIVRPDIPISTREAFAHITPQMPKKCCREIVMQPVDTWKEELVNDFEQSVFASHPELEDIKRKIYDEGAVYASMSGSGSAFFGLFKNEINLSKVFPDMFTISLKL